MLGAGSIVSGQRAELWSSTGFAGIISDLPHARRNFGAIATVLFRSALLLFYDNNIHQYSAEIDPQVFSTVSAMCDAHDTETSLVSLHHCYQVNNLPRKLQHASFVLVRVFGTHLWKACLYVRLGLSHASMHPN